MSKSLIIVESPTKARTIEKFLGKDFEVLASYGHVRDLPEDAAQIPAKFKKEKWARVGINVDSAYEPLYIVPEEKERRVQELKRALKDAKELYLATDEDREGESISWHLLEVLKPTVPVKRLVFHEITKGAIQHALQTPRAIDENLVRAQETRRIIDRLFGYCVSPLLWKKVKPRLSAGRVQSVAMRLLVERERERIRFRPSEYWDLDATLVPVGRDESFVAELSHVEGRKVASGKDFDPTTGKLYPDSDVVHLLEESARALKDRLLKESGIVENVEEKPFTNRPYPPFTTSTLQQEASRKMGYSAKWTMQVAQMLYENGFITYMRTDSTNLSEEALTASRALIKRDFGEAYLPDAPRLYKTKVKNAQEAHEAIRPSGSEFVAPAVVREKLGPDAFRLYEMIWKRTIASQMKDATGTRVSVQIRVDDALFRASGRTIQFPGFLRAYVEGSDDPEADLADREKILPPLAKGDRLSIKGVNALSHTTQAPPRFTEGSLIKELERLGIGRPSTWATIVDVVLQRSYAFKRGNALVPSFLAAAVTSLMERYLQRVIDYEFTAHLEEDLDAISRGEADNLSYLNAFFRGDRPGLEQLVKRGEEIIDPRDVCGVPVGKIDGKTIEVRIGRYGPFVTDGEVRAGLPDGLAPDELTIDVAQQLLLDAMKGPESLGVHPESGRPIYLKKGRFGPYIQEGDGGEGEEKPRMASLLPGMVPEEISLEVALKLLTLPRTLGVDSETGEEVSVANGRYGPYVKRGSESRSIPLDLSPLDISIADAIEILRQPKTRGRRTAEPKILKDLGKHPVSNLALSLRNGRYGPYVTDGTINASLTRTMSVEELTLEDAISLIDQRALKVAEAPPKKRRGSAKKAAEKPKGSDEEPAKKGGAKKAAPKKGATSAKKKAAPSKKESNPRSKSGPTA